MPTILPFRTLWFSSSAGPLEDLFYLPGETGSAPCNPISAEVLKDTDAISRAISSGILSEDEREALFIYRQQFLGAADQSVCIREGVMGLLGANSRIFPHEQTCPERVADCRRRLLDSKAHLSSLTLLYDGGNQRSLTHLLRASSEGPASFEVTDPFECRHQFWRVVDGVAIAKFQAELEGEALVLIDGHHRYEAGARLATVQVRTEHVRSLAVHRLVLNAAGLQIPPGPALPNFEALQSYWADTPSGTVRFAVAVPGQALSGLELPSGENPSILTLHRTLLQTHISRPIRGMGNAIDAVKRGSAELAFLLQPPSTEAVIRNAQRGVLLPPKSTDFFPKIAAGLVMHRITAGERL